MKNTTGLIGVDSYVIFQEYVESFSRTGFNSSLTGDIPERDAAENFEVVDRNGTPASPVDSLSTAGARV